MNSPSKSIQEQLLEATDAIEGALKNNIYVTRFRLTEILKNNHNWFKDNFYLSASNALLFVLLCLRESGNIEIISRWGMIPGERFEEGESEPTLYDDIPSEELRNLINEIRFSMWFEQGKSYNDVNEELRGHDHSDVLQVIEILKKEGVSRHTVFYKRVDTPKNKKEETLPALPVTID